MSVILKEVEEALKYFQPSPAVYRLSSGWGNSIQFNKILRPHTDDQSFISNMIVGRHGAVEEHLNLKTLKHELSYKPHDITNNIRWEVHRYLQSFISRHGGSKNNKLTTLYRWFNGAVAAHTMVEHPDLESDLWNIFKWIKSMDVQKTVDAQYAGAIQLLEIIKQRYEAKGIKV